MKNLLLFTLLISNIILGQSFVPNAPDLNLKGYILIDPDYKSCNGAVNF